MTIADLLVDTLALDPLGDRGPALSARWGTVPLDRLEPILRYEGAAAWLHRRWRDLEIPATLPPALAARVRGLAVAEHSTALRVETAATRALDILRNAGCEVVLLKGLAYRVAAPAFPWLDCRPTVDVDLLVAESDASRAWRALRDEGYRAKDDGPGFESPEYVRVGHHHLNGLWAEDQVAVELHTSSSPNVPPATAWARMRTGATELAWRGREVLVPSTTELFWHAVEHSFNDGAQGFLLKKFLPAAALIAAGAPLDVEELSHRIERESLQEVDRGRPVSRLAIHRWVAIATVLGGSAGRGMPWQGGRPHLLRMLAWRERWLSGQRGAERFTSYLLAEGTRREAGMDRGSPIAAWSLLNRLKFWFVSLAARATYRLIGP